MKFVKQLFPITMLLLGAASWSFAHLIDPDTGTSFQYRAELAVVAPVVDGFFDDPVWGEVTAGKMEQDVMENKRWRSSDDFDGTFAAVWRNGFLYLAIKLTDDRVETHHEKLSRQDHLEVYLDIDHTGHKSDLYRYVIPVGRNVSLSYSPFMLIAWGNGGQSCELSFNLGHTPRKGDTIGFGIYYNDADGGRLHHRIGWGPIGLTESEESLADLVFSAKLKPNENQKAVQWGRIKSLY
jgi:hypothetical protein